MATKSGKSKKQRTLTYFFWQGRLHRVIRINRPVNLVDAWCYEEKKRVSILLSDYRVSAQPAVTMKKACEIMKISRRTMKRALTEGKVHMPVRSYPLGDQDRKDGYMFFGEENLLELHDYFMTVHKGRPRKDGEITPNQNLPTKAEIKAKLNNATVLYIQGDDGTFVPLYEPPKF